MVDPQDQLATLHRTYNQLLDLLARDGYVTQQLVEERHPAARGRDQFSPIGRLLPAGAKASAQDVFRGKECIAPIQDAFSISR